MKYRSLLDFPAFVISMHPAKLSVSIHRDNVHYLYPSSYYPVSVPFVRMYSEWQEMELQVLSILVTMPSRRHCRDWHGLGDVSAI
jgi:hypothetical protein